MSSAHSSFTIDDVVYENLVDAVENNDRQRFDGNTLRTQDPMQQSCINRVTCERSNERFDRFLEMHLNDPTRMLRMLQHNAINITPQPGHGSYRGRVEEHWPYGLDGGCPSFFQGDLAAVGVLVRNRADGCSAVSNAGALDQVTFMVTGAEPTVRNYATVANVAIIAAGPDAVSDVVMDVECFDAAGIDSTTDIPETKCKRKAPDAPRDDTAGPLLKRLHVCFGHLCDFEM